MIINTGNRTDIPAFYSDWFYNRIKEGFVCVRNPYFPKQVTQYQLSRDVVDMIIFCSKNPQPMLDRLDIIKGYPQFWSITITPYDQSIEPYVPNKNEIIRSFKKLSNKVGINCIGWRYDPIFISEKYTINYHLSIFEQMCQRLHGYTHQCVISFIDLYEKTKKNFPGIHSVSLEDQFYITKCFVKIAKKYDIEIYTCHENKILKEAGANTTGCLSLAILEKAAGFSFNIPLHQQNTRTGCSCLLNHDIGVYNSCLHGCLYCYANDNRKTVIQNYRHHDCLSPFLIGHEQKDDIIKKAKQSSYKNKQLSLF
ncbi:MAG: DUF1848 domain-containing protein [Faecalibacillus sp.]